jgi:photosystem II stability/assembly factor-like uncharacterized protein
MTVNPKTIFLLLLLSFLSCGDVLAQSWGQWTLSEPKYTYEDFRAIFFIDTLQGWAGDEAGRVFHTTDGGETWNYQARGLGGGIYDIQFIDQNEGWIAAFIGIWHTTDGGNNWEQVGRQRHIDEVPTNIYFLDRQHGWCSTRSGSNVVYSQDGGKTWLESNQITGLPIGTNFLENIFFVDNSNGWFSYNDKIYSSTDGGKNWKVRAQLGDGTVAFRIEKLHFFSPLVGYAITLGHVFKTIDGGWSWTIIKQHPKFDRSIGRIYHADAYFLNNQHFWVCGLDSVYRTTDGGVSWEASPLCGLHHSIQFANANLGWCSGQSGSICKTTDGGITWRHIGTTVGAGYGPVASDDSNTIFAVAGCQTTIIRRRDKGQSWQPIPIQTESPIVALKMLDKDHLWAITAHSKLYATTDGGDSWEQYYAFLPDSIAATYAFQLEKCGGIPIQFINAQLGYACVDIFNKESKTITTSLLKTTNGGKAWNEIHQRTANAEKYYPQYKNISFIDSVNGWYYLDSPDRTTIQLLQTTDGGKKWEKLFNLTNHCNETVYPECMLGIGIHFFDKDNGTTYTNASVTTDGGKTWVKNNDLRENNQLRYFRSMSFIDSLEWWAGGYIGETTGQLSYTRNGGKNWQEFERKITFVDFKSRHDGWGSNEKGIWRFSGDPTSTNEARTTPPPSVAIYPNPVDDILTIQCHIPQATAIHLLDLQGRSIAHQHQAPAGSFSLPVHDIPNGMYILQVHFQDGTQKGTKVVVQH